ncbi:hypothetical protein HDU80_003141 [Chytriomyces hyalinus]|nr:hypothetical protein HDU80_003141 [Chytriomyces hyalinus]
MRKAKATLAAVNWTKEQDTLLYDYLKEHDDGNMTGISVKKAVPGLRAFVSSTLNSKIKTIRKLVNTPADDSDDSDDETVLPPPHIAFPGMCRDPSQARPVSNKRHKPESPKKPTVVDATVYSKAVTIATPFVSTLRLHDLMRFMDEDTGLHHVQIILRIVTDHHIQYNVTADGKQLAIVQYFHNDPGTEEFTYTINLPEPVDSNCVDMRNVLRTVETIDMSGKMVRIQQRVAKVLVYMVSGQRSGDRESDWA